MMNLLTPKWMKIFTKSNLSVQSEILILILLKIEFFFFRYFLYQNTL
jgi:hypothetical protein